MYGNLGNHGFTETTVDGRRVVGCESCSPTILRGIACHAPGCPKAARALPIRRAKRSLGSTTQRTTRSTQRRLAVPKLK